MAQLPWFAGSEFDAFQAALDTGDSDEIRDAGKDLDSVCNIGGGQLPKKKDLAILAMVEGTQIIRSQNEQLIESSGQIIVSCLQNCMRIAIDLS